MIEALLELPEHLRLRLVRALETGELAPPYPEGALRRALDGADVGPVQAALREADEAGGGAEGTALAIRLAGQAVAGVSRPELVWSGPEVRGLHARDTRRVYEELVGIARERLWISTYTYYNGPKAFKSLADRMAATSGLQATLLLNIQRKPGDTTASDELAMRFAKRLWEEDWPGSRRPEVFYDPRALELKGQKAVLHAKAIVVDDETALVTSANLTEAAFDHNIEVGVLSRDRTLAASLARHFRVLIERKLLVPLPDA